MNVIVAPKEVLQVTPLEKFDPSILNPLLNAPKKRDGGYDFATIDFSFLREPYEREALNTSLRATTFEGAEALRATWPKELSGFTGTYPDGEIRAAFPGITDEQAIRFKAFVIGVTNQLKDPANPDLPDKSFKRVDIQARTHRYRGLIQIFARALESETMDREIRQKQAKAIELEKLKTPGEKILDALDELAVFRGNFQKLTPMHVQLLIDTFGESQIPRLVSLLLAEGSVSGSNADVLNIARRRSPKEQFDGKDKEYSEMMFQRLPSSTEGYRFVDDSGLEHSFTLAQLNEEMDRPGSTLALVGMVAVIRSMGIPEDQFLALGSPLKNIEGWHNLLRRFTVDLSRAVHPDGMEESQIQDPEVKKFGLDVFNFYKLSENQIVFQAALYNALKPKKNIVVDTV